MNTNKRNKVCADLHTAAAALIADVSLLRHYDESQQWAKDMVINDLRRIVAAAAFLGVTTKNVKNEMQDLVSFFNECEGGKND